MNKKNSFSALIGCAALLASHGLAADQSGARVEAAFKKADTDNDGILTRAEAKSMPRVAKNFDVIDADKDGTVSDKEIHDYMKAHRAKK